MAAAYTNMTLRCSYGTLSSVLGFGLVEEDTDVCNEEEMDSLSFIDGECRNDKLFAKPADEDIFQKVFNEDCKNNPSCTFKVDDVFAPTRLSKECQNKKAAIGHQNATWVLVYACR